MKKLIQVLFYPVLLSVAVGAYLALYQSWSYGLENLVYVIGFASIAFIFLSEYLFPFRKDWQPKILNFRFGVDAFHTNILLPILSRLIQFALPLMVLQLPASTRGLSFFPKQAPVLLQAILALLICEFFFYWVHRLYHESSMFWRLHRYHHRVDRVYWNNSGRFHPVDLLTSFGIYFFPLYLLGLSQEVISLFVLINAITGLLEHANVDFKLGELNRIFNSAELHRWHHSSVVEECNSNYGKVLSIWDQCFGTYLRPKNQTVEKVGI